MTQAHHNSPQATAHGTGKAHLSIVEVALFLCATNPSSPYYDIGLAEEKNLRQKMRHFDKIVDEVFK